MTTATLPVVERFRVRAVRVPMAEPHQTASGFLTESPLVLLDIFSGDGVVGHAIVFTYTSAALKPVAELLSNLEPMVAGEPLAPVDVAAKLAARFRLLGTQGLVGMALAGVDMALWDALARSHGVSLTRLLGGVEAPVRPYGAVGFDGVEGSAAATERLAREGFTGIKAKIGYASVSEDVAVLRAMRAAAGEDIVIMVDYNQSLSPVEAEKRLAALDELGLGWVEEPTLAHDYAGHARVARAANTPIQCGENWWGIRDLEHALDAGASDLVMPDVMKIGGVTGWIKAAAMAEARAIPMSNHLWPELSARLLCVTPTAHWLEYVDWWNPVLAEPLVLDRGLARVDSRPGSGIEWNEEEIGRFAA
jgi:mandelate racemase